MTTAVALTPPAFTARRYGRSGAGYTLAGEKLTSVTRIISEGFPKPALMAWNAREVAAAAVRLRDAMPHLDDDEMRDLLAGAPNRKRNKAANRGTEVHRLAERLALGESVMVPSELEAHVEHYVAFLNAWELTDALLERPVCNEAMDCYDLRLAYGGRVDMFARSNRVGYALWDIKTSGSGIFGEIALQLTGYERARWYIAENGEVLPMPKFDAAMAIHVTEKGHNVFQVETGEREWNAFRSCAYTAYWREHEEGRVIGDSMWQSQEVG